MANIAIVTDSTAYLPKVFIESNNIKVVSLKIHWDDDDFIDGVSITPAEFYKRLEKSSTIPTTSQPSMEEFLRIFEELAPHCDGIVVPLISSGISGTVASAQAAVTEFSQVPVEIIDSRSTSAGLALVVIAIAQAVSEGKSLEEIKRLADSIVERMKIFFVVDTLEYLHKGGRIGGASRFLGTALSIKPILYFDENGKIDGLEKVRIKNKALKRILELTVEGIGDKKAVISLIHANALKEVEQFRNEVQGYFPENQIDVYDLSPVIGTHVGPGTIGIASYTV